ncbi:hypothetical protein CRG98_017679 [Punica granatum]|uniref:Nuclear factor related to kappa-B-binding protein second winged helix domain-containing protein n=1 Tax=Punica granatum TaxID=22663 RepID=A0A2I0K1J2_PUNGR|nr:hypothetical protein CRG98_017679 [Punica granatum]
MAIEKNNFKAARFDSECSPGSRDSMSGDEDEFQVRASGPESDEDDDFDDADSGAGSDDFDLLELGETGAEFCQETYMHTMMELFKGCNFHFGSPLKKLFDMLKGGLCEPRVALYREGRNSFDKREHYHFLKMHQNGLVSNLCQIRDAWLNCRGYSIEEKLRVLNIVKSQKSLMCEKEDMESESSGREELAERLWSRRSKDRKLGQIMGPSSVYGVGPDLEPSLALEPAKYRKQNSKGVLKLGALKTTSGRQLVSGLPTLNPGSDLKSGAYSSLTLPWQSKMATSDMGLATTRIRDRMPGYDEVEDPIFGAGSRRDQITSSRFSTEKQGRLAARKKPDFLSGDEIAMDGFVGLPLSSKGDLLVYGRNKHSNEPFDVRMMKANQSSIRPSYDYVTKAKYSGMHQGFAGEIQKKSMKGLKGNQGGSHDPNESFWHAGTEEEALHMDPQLQFDDWNPRSKKLKVQRESGLSVKSHRASIPQMSNRFLTPEMKGRHSYENISGSSLKNGAMNMILNGDVTESGSSDSYGDDESNPLMRNKLAYPSGFMEEPSSLVKSSVDGKKGKFVKKEKKQNARGSDRDLQSYQKDDLGEHLYPPEEKEGGGGGDEEEVYPSKGKKKMKKSKIRGDPSVRTSTRVKEGNFLYGTGTDDRKKPHKVHKNDQLEVRPSEGLAVSPLVTDPIEGKQTGVGSVHDYAVVEEDGLIEKHPLADGKRASKRRKKVKNMNTSDATVSVRNLAKRKRKGKAVETADHDDDGNRLHADTQQEIHANAQQEIEEPSLLEKQIGQKTGDDGVASDNETSEMPIVDTGVPDMELDSGPPKKSFTLITPTVHTDFSFSIIHLLSAVRVAMISPPLEDSLDVGPQMEDAGRIQEGGINEESSSQKNVDAAGNSEQEPQCNAPCLTIQEIVNRVRSNPGDPCILETQEPLQDLVRGVLKSFSSKSASLGAKGWKALVVYERLKKRWRWTGPVPYNLPDHETIEEVTSPEAWGLPHKMLVKLVDSFASWLKSSQDTLQKLGSLPPPPLELMQCNVDEKERFRDLRAQKSLNTIYPSSEEVREYFRREEFLRYSIPDRAFQYTAADGKKSVVAPLRRCGGKPTSKARDHFMLKRDRPPHVTILCLVRDAAARLPGSIGTRADVCTLIRDSQYIVEDVTDVQINQIVSGALDRLHYERDPCVQFDAERKLWKYLHREREEEDFEDDGTSSTKKWRRPKKDTTEPSDQGTVTVAYHGSGEQTGYDMCSDLNVEPAPIDGDKAVDPIMTDDLGQNIGDICNNGAEHTGIPQDQPMVWEGFDLNPLRENKLLCQENSTNEDFDDETFGRERPVGLLSAGLL